VGNSASAYPTDFLVERFRAQGGARAVSSPAGGCTFAQLLELWRQWVAELERTGVERGTVVGLDGDFSPNAIALFLALAEREAILVPQSAATRAGRERKDEIAEVEAYFYVDEADDVRFERAGRTASHSLYRELRARGHPGIVLFSSGTSGEPKAAVHDLTLLLEKFEQPRPALTTLVFLLFDHWGGLNTMLHALSNGATVVSTGGDRSPEGICEAIARHRVELLPTTPTFLNLLLMSGAQRRHDLSSLRVISYGAEPMPESTLERLREAFPGVRLQQTYGLIEVGAMRSKSREDGSLWVKVGGEGYETRVVDGILQIKARSMVMGYVNAPDPITDDGWLVTGDAVLQDGEYLRVLGRRSELINVGGEKVYPAEVESVIQSLDRVAEVAVHGEPHPMTGQIVCARVRAGDRGDSRDLARMVKRYCRERLERYKVPVKVEVVDEPLFGARFKKQRRLP
jgi:acyl-coenzyme A synthetase/AMP-(fatty) acid ligase